MLVSKISSYRNEIMGVAILWVMLFHARIEFPSTILVPVEFIKSIGYGAVDLFFFLSGFGLFYSWSSKKLSTIEFYKGRLVRVLPSYWIVVTMYFTVHFLQAGTFSLSDYLSMLTGLNFYLHNDKFLWFIPAIVGCYLLFPVMIRCIRFEVTNQNLAKNVAVAIAATLIVSWAVTATDFYHLLIVMLRLPAFILGMYAGYAFVHQVNLPWFESIKMNGVVLLLGIALLWAVLSLSTAADRWRFGLWWYPFIFLVYPLCLLIAGLIQWMDSYGAANTMLQRVKRLMSFCGAYSLGIYLIHLVIFRTFPPFMKDLLPRVVEGRINVGRVAEFSMYMALAVCLSPLLAKAASFHRPAAVPPRSAEAAN